MSGIYKYIAVDWLKTGWIFRINELEGQMECLDDVDPRVFEEFKQLKASLAQLVSLFKMFLLSILFFLS
jgi:hypothetical protein